MLPVPQLPKASPPYYAVIFTSRRPSASVDPAGHAAYSQTARHLSSLAQSQRGYLGEQNLSSLPDELGMLSAVSISYWAEERDVRNWKAVSDHRLGQRIGKEQWYTDYSVQVAKVERAYAWERGDGGEQAQEGSTGGGK